MRVFMLVLMVRFIRIGYKVLIECSNKIPIIVKFLFAKFDRVNMNANLHLCHRILQYPQIEHVFVLRFGLVYDPIDEKDPRIIVIEDAAINNSFAELFDLKGERGVIDYGVDPG